MCDGVSLTTSGKYSNMLGWVSDVVAVAARLPSTPPDSEQNHLCKIFSTLDPDPHSIRMRIRIQEGKINTTEKCKKIGKIVTSSMVFYS